MSQPESKRSREIRLALTAAGAFVFKVHGGPLMMAGLPDLIACYQGEYFGLETKMAGGQASEIQKLRHRQIRAAGGVAEIVRSVEEARRVVFEGWRPSSGSSSAE